MKQLQKIVKRRKFAESFKRQIVREFESGRYSVLELSSLHKINFRLIYRWIYKYSNVNQKGYRIVEMSQSSTQKVKDLQDRIKELERIVGQKQIEIDYLDKLIDLAGEELGIDIKKNSATPQSNGSKPTGKK